MWWRAHRRRSTGRCNRCLCVCVPCCIDRMCSLAELCLCLPLSLSLAVSLSLSMYVCIYVCIYIRTCYVLTKPPIQSSPCNHIANLRPNVFYNAREQTQGPPLVTNLKKLFFIFQSHFSEFQNLFFYFFRCNYIMNFRELIPCKRLKEMLNIGLYRF